MGGRAGDDAEGFAKARAAGTGRPPYDPADLLKPYLYGYLNQIRSSRKLERESQRNIEVLWLRNRLTPDHKTIANFRRENGAAFAAPCRSFVCFCRGEGLIGGERVAIDGSKFQAVASKRQVVSRKHLAHQLATIDADIARYLAELQAGDRAEAQATAAPSASAVRETLARLRAQRESVADAHAHMTAANIEHRVLGEEDARMMRTGQGAAKIAYNVQSAVDGAHGLILHHAVTQEATDNRQLAPMALAAKEVLEAASLTVVADAGFSNGEQLAACEATGITAYVPPNRATNNQGDGQFFPKSAFVFDEPREAYRCPAGHDAPAPCAGRASIRHAQGAHPGRRPVLVARAGRCAHRILAGGAGVQLQTGRQHPRHGGRPRRGCLSGNRSARLHQTTKKNAPLARGIFWPAFTIRFYIVCVAAFF